MHGSSALSFYRGKTVLVTGHTGFKGAWLCLWLRELGARVAGLALPPPAGRPSLFGEARVGDSVASALADVRDLPAVSRVFADERPDVVFHLAAQSLVRRSYREPVETFATNVMGTVHVLQAAAQTPSVRAVVVVTSDKCYENREWSWGYRENDRLGGRDPYSASKGCAELVADSYRRSFFQGPGAAGVATARAGNVIGGGDWAEDRLLPDLVTAALAGEPVTLRNPRATRPWQHVLEPLAGYLLLGRELHCRPADFAEAWNFGPPADDVLTVGEVAEKVVALLGRGELRADETAGAPHEAGSLRLDSTKAREQLGWRPLLAVDEALAWTVQWYSRWAKDRAASRAAALEQIAEYTARTAS